MNAEDKSAIDVSRLAPAADLGEVGESPPHQVQFYDENSFLLDRVSRFIGDGLEAGGGGVVIATKPHLDGIEERLMARGLDMAAARAQGQYVPLDAAETLSTFMKDGSPDERRFSETVGAVIAAAAQGRPCVRTFGEMVALLWAAGNGKAAIRLEELWRDLGRKQSVSVLCAYPMRDFGGAADGKAFSEICAEHSGVIPAESYAALPTPGERLRVIAQLQQKAEALKTEIAERRQLEQALRRREKELADLLAGEQAARAEAEAANRSKDQFLATLSHELRTPLTAMLGWVRMLRAGSLDSAASDRGLEVIERNTYNLGQLVSDLLDVSRIITGKMTLSIGSVDLVHVIGIVIDSVRPAADAKRITIRPAMDHSVRPLLADADRLQQVIWNLLSNAVKFTPNGGRVEVLLTALDEGARITVTDTGKGIAPDFLPYLFRRFRQADSSSTRMQPGLGLGLAIARHLVELHGGAVRAESAGAGKGATFVVDLPYGVPREAAAPQPASMVPARPLAMPSDSLQGVRVLVVDDSDDTCELLTMILKQQGAEASSTTSARDALALFGEAPPDVFVCDIAMPGIDGYQLLREIRSRAREAGDGVFAVALTAYARPEDRERALAAGFDRYIAKPVEPGDFVRVIVQIAEKRLRL